MKPTIKFLGVGGAFAPLSKGHATIHTMNEKGEIYSAPADQIPAEDYDRLKKFIDQAFEQLKIEEAKVPKQMKFDFVDGGEF